MKKIFLFSIILLSSVIANCQPIIDSTSFTPIDKEKFIRNRCAYNLPATTIASGSNILWDFSNLITAQKDSFTYVIPDTLANQNNCGQYFNYEYSKANFSVINSLNPIALFQYTKDAKIEWGECWSGQAYQKSYIVEFAFPLTYKDSSLDTFYSTTTVFQPMQRDQQTQYIYKLNADGYGTLLLPNASYSNALKVAVISQDSMYDPYYYPNGQKTVDTIYYWLVPSVHHPVLQVSYFQGNQFAYYISKIVLSKQEVQKNFFVSAYPNPFCEQATLKTDHIMRNATLTLYSSFGQLVKQIESLSGQTITLQRDDLPSGLYFLRLTEGGKVFATEKLVITNR